MKGLVKEKSQAWKKYIETKAREDRDKDTEKKNNVKR